MQLTNRERAAAIVLGYDRRMWDDLDTGPTPNSENKAWFELSQLERAAAMRLGYNQRNWDNESGFERQPSIENKSWDDLTGDEQYAAFVLGYNRGIWDGPQPDSVYKSWSELTTCGGDSSTPRLLPTHVVSYETSCIHSIGVTLMRSPFLPGTIFHLSLLHVLSAQQQDQEAQVKEEQMLSTNGTQSSGI